MAFVNDPLGYKALIPREEHIAFDPTAEHITAEDGLYYRAASAGYEVEIRDRLLSNMAQATLTDYQYWAERGWKAEHGTTEAVKRFGVKMFEEYDELTVAYESLRSVCDIGTPYARRHLLSELGDVAYCLTANASNSAAGLDAGMKNALYRYVMGIQHYSPGGNRVPAVWRNYAARLATQFSEIRIGQLDTLLRQQFEPTYSAIMNIDIDEDDSFDGDILDHVMVLRGRLSAMRIASEEQYGHDEDDEDLDEKERNFIHIMPEYFKEQSDLIREQAAVSLLEVAFIGRRMLGKSLGSILQHNVRKVDARIKHGLVDKADGERPGELR